MSSRFRRFVPCALLLLLVSCSQQGDRVTAVPPAGGLVTGNRQTELQPGRPVSVRHIPNPFEGDDTAVAQGKRLYNQYNCSGCHAAGGGAIGPPLMDDEWIYGSSPSNVFWTVVEGRPQGMPAFGGRISEDQIWRIVAYVRSLSGLDKQESGPSQGTSGGR